MKNGCWEDKDIRNFFYPNNPFYYEVKKHIAALLSPRQTKQERILNNFFTDALNGKPVKLIAEIGGAPGKEKVALKIVKYNPEA